MSKILAKNAPASFHLPKEAGKTAFPYEDCVKPLETRAREAVEFLLRNQQEVSISAVCTHIGIERHEIEGNKYRLLRIWIRRQAEAVTVGYVELPESLLKRLKHKRGRNGRTVDQAAILEVAKLIGLVHPDSQTWKSGSHKDWNTTIDWLDEHYPLWRGFEVNLTGYAARARGAA